MQQTPQTPRMLDEIVRDKCGSTLLQYQLDCAGNQYQPTSCSLPPLSSPFLTPTDLVLLSSLKQSFSQLLQNVELLNTRSDQDEIVSVVLYCLYVTNRSYRLDDDFFRLYNTIAANSPLQKGGLAGLRFDGPPPRPGGGGGGGGGLGVLGSQPPPRPGGLGGLPSQAPPRPGGLGGLSSQPPPRPAGGLSVLGNQPPPRPQRKH